MIEFKNDYHRQTENFKTLSQELKVTRAQNGELIYSVNTLQMTSDEVKKTLPAVEAELKNMGLKLKNTQSITDVKYSYKTIYDTVKASKEFKYENDIISYDVNKIVDSTKVSGKINVPVNYDSTYQLYNIDFVKQPYLNNLSFEYKGNLSIINEIQYRRSWIFWKKPVGVKTHIKSNNDSFKIDQIQSIQLVK